MQRYENLIGQAIAPYGYGWGAGPVFGADASGAPGPLAPGAGGMGINPGYVPHAMSADTCWGDPAVVDPTFQQRRLFSAIFGAQCGPLLQQLPMPFENVGCIEDGEEVDIRAFPQYWSKLVRLFLPPSQAAGFVVTGIFAGITPVMVSTGELPGEMFLPDSENVLFNSVTLFPNQPFVLRVRNESGAPSKLKPGAVVMCISGGMGQIYGPPLGSM